MTIRDALARAARSLKETRVETPRLDAEILLTHLLKKNTAYLLAHPEVKLTPAIKRRFFALVRRRAKREPLAYITGHKEFYGLNFSVNRHTLVPRPETEWIIETITNVLRTNYYVLPTTIIDVGTGSGAIAVTLSKLLPRATVYATDTSARALRVARANAKRHGVPVNFCDGNLIAPVIPKFIFDPIGSKMNFPSPTHTIQRNIQVFVVANLPYLTTTQWRAAQPEVKKYEPRQALDGGPDGLKYYRQLVKQIKKLLIPSQRVSKVDKPQLGYFRARPRPFGLDDQKSGARQGGNEQSEVINYSLLITLCFEIDPRQNKPLTNTIRKIFPAARVQIKKDLAGQDRVLIAHLPSVEHR